MMTLKTSEDWYKPIRKKGLLILDADGWDRTNYDFSFKEEKISLDEFNRRVSMSTCIYDTEVQAVSYIRECLDDAIEHKLEADVVYYALRIMKENPTLDIQQAMESGMEEFDV